MRKYKLFGQGLFACTVLAVLALAVQAQDTKKGPNKSDEDDREPDVIFVPTPLDVVEKMLEIAKVGKKDIVYDLGCGDGRIPLTAARKYGCKSTGFDINPVRIKECMDNFKKEKEEVQKLVTFHRKDLFKQDLSDANVITLYLLPSLNVKLVPQLKKLKKGSRIVSHAFDMRGYKPDQRISFMSKDTNREHDIYLWTIPLVAEKTDD